jgi:mRNA interferase MazF
MVIRQGEGNLPKDSVVNISQILTVNKTDLLPEDKIGQLSALKIDLIVSGLRTIF